MSAKTRSTRRRRGLNRRGLLARTGAGAVAVGAVAGAGGLGTALAAQTPLINLAMSQEPTTLGYGIGNATVETIAKRALGSEPQLTIAIDTLDYIPWLADNVPTLENGLASIVGEGADAQLHVRFTMRQDVTWTDGTPLTAHDVRFAWWLRMSPDYPVSSREVDNKISDIDVTGDYALTVKYLSETEARYAADHGREVNGPLPAAQFVDYRTQNGPVLDPNYYKGYTAYPRHALQPLIADVGIAQLRTLPIMRAPLGIGPFKVREWIPGQAIVNDAVPTFFLGAPRTAQLNMKFVTDTNAIVAQLAAGEVDIITHDALDEFRAPELDRLERERRARAYYVIGTSWEHVDINIDNPHLKDVRVRKALAHAVNRQLMVDRVLNGKTSVIHSWSPAWRWDYNSDVPRYDFNPQKARDLLREAGYTAGSDGILRKDGQKLSLKYYTVAGNQMRLLTSQIAQQNLKDVGIEIELVYQPIAELFATAATNPGPLTARSFDLGQYAWSAPEDPATTRNLYSSSAIPTRENNWVGQNYPGYKNTRNDELLTQAASSLDQAERTRLYHLQQSVWADELPVLPYFARANVNATSRGVQNYRPGPTSTVPATWNSHDWYIA